MFKILENANKIIFLNPHYRSKLLYKSPDSLQENIQKKSCIIPNGINKTWLKSYRNNDSNNSSGTLKIVYVGDFSKNKNIHRLIDAIIALSHQRKVLLTIVGYGNSNQEKLLKNRASENKNIINYIGRVDDENELRKIYSSNHIFAMPSMFETFGLVYIEALSQGLPVITSYGQGVDGYFKPGTISEAVDPSSTLDIIRGINLYLKELT